MSEPQPEGLAPVTIQTALAQRIQEAIGENVYLCYQCVKCTSGCPLARFFDWQPNQIMRALQLGQADIALGASTPWLCAGCQTCATRCPQGIDVTAVMEFLTREARAQGIEPPLPQVAQFNRAFMRQVRWWGRAYELGMLAEMKLRTGDLTGDLDLGLKMMRKRKLAILPERGRPPRRVKPVPEASKAVAYYPGCSLHSTAVEFDASARAVCEAVEMTLIEPEGWVCCGSSAAHRVDPETAVRLPLQNLTLLEQSGFSEVVMPCAACFNRHKSAQYEMRQNETHKAEMGVAYQDSVAVRTLPEALLRHVGIEKVAWRVRRPLSGLRVVAYYGCLLTRPPQVTEAEHPENPTQLDALLQALGAEVVDWSYKTSCCGASHALTRPDIVLSLSGDLLAHAREAGADVMAVVCPLCHANLDARQFQMKLAEPLPVLFFTQLMALAFGLPEKAAAFDKNLVDPRPLLHRKGLL